jgi:hypothetical protein
MAETRKRRRIRGSLALAGAFSTVALILLTVVNLDPEGSLGAWLAWCFGSMGAFVSTALLVDAWLAEDGVWLRNEKTGRRRPRLGPGQDLLHRLSYR